MTKLENILLKFMADISRMVLLLNYVYQEIRESVQQQDITRPQKLLQGEQEKDLI